MAVPIDPALISGAVTIAAPTIATPTFLCKPPPEGAKFISLQVAMGVGHPWFVDLSTGVPPPLSQAVCMYVDATQSLVDVTILFPDSGYEVTVQAANTLLFPIISDTTLPKFYVIQASNTVLLAGTVNLFILNQFIPEFGSNYYQKNLIYGTNAAYSSDTVTFPAESFSGAQTVTLSTSGSLLFPSLFAANNTIITGLQLYVHTQASAATVKAISIYQDGDMLSPMWNIPVLFDTAEQVQKIIECGYFLNARTIASTHNKLYIAIDDITDLTLYDAYVNFQFASNNSTI